MAAALLLDTSGGAQASTEEVFVIEADREEPGETRRAVPPEIALTIPGTQGDALKAIQNLPGLARVPYGAGALLVRGAAPGDTRVLLDGQEIPQLYHFAGVTSVVATECLASIDFLPGGYGVRYGGALAGVVDAKSRGGSRASDPDERERVSTSLDADVFDAGALVMGPVGSGAPAGHFIAAARRSYVDAVLPLVVPASTLNLTVAPRYYDWQFRWDAPNNERGSRAHVFTYGSDDAMSFVVKKPPDEGADLRGRFLVRTAFQRLQASWARPIAGSWWLEVSPGAGYQTTIVDAIGLFAIDTRQRDLTLRAETGGPMGEGLQLLAGVEGRAESNRYRVRTTDDVDFQQFPGGPESVNLEADGDYEVGTAALYVQSEIALGALSLVPGVRIDGYFPADALSVDPRIAARLHLGRGTSAKAYVGLHHQAPEFLEWDAKAGNPHLRPERALQTGLGAASSLGAHSRIEAEVFWKWLDDLVVVMPGDPSDPDAGGRYTNAGIGRSYGLEAILRRELAGSAHGWIAYTLSRSERADPATAGGWRPFTFDQTHILTAVAGFRLGRGWDAGARFRYATGNPVTPVNDAIYDSDEDVFVPVSGPENGSRLPPFEQLDLRIDKRFTWRYLRLTTYFEVQNLYAARNPEAVRYDYAFQRKYYLTGLPLIPSAGIKGEF